MVNVFLTISYDGTNYSGWQRQKNAVSVQGAVELALSGLLKTDIVITGASRTDAGVHALCQKAAFFIDGIKIPMNKLPLAINAALPKDIVITKAEIIEDGRHPRFSAKQKTYEYRIFNDKFMNPLLRNYCWHVQKTLNIRHMAAAAEYIKGTHDFTAFCASGSDTKDFVRTVFDLEIDVKGKVVSVTITGNGFLYNMARIITGTLCYVGLGKIAPEDIKGIILSKDRTLSGITAPPQGLTLLDIVY